MKASRFQLIEKAQEYLQKSIELLEVALKDDRNAQAYLLDHLKILASEDHGFLSNDLNLDKLMRKYCDDDEKIKITDDIYLLLTEE